jgi:flavin-dependent dehydrogenase
MDKGPSGCDHERDGLWIIGTGEQERTGRYMSHDVMVIGAGSAGSAVAATLAAKGQRVLVIEQEAQDQPHPQTPDWLPMPGVQILSEMGLEPAAYVQAPLTGVVFHSEDLVRSAAARQSEPVAVRVDYQRLVARLRELAANLGVETVYGSAPACLDAAERQVGAFFDGRDPLAAAFMVMADGAARTWATAGETPGRWIAERVFPMSREPGDECVHFVLGMDAGRSYASWWSDSEHLVIRLDAAGTAEAVRQYLELFVKRLWDRGLLPTGALSDALVATVRHAPARPALEVDSHVGKRSLRIGDAGGFLAATSREGIYPALWSARLAAEVLVFAAARPHPQDILRQFSSIWRSVMGQYLGSPGNDVQFLLPLIFGNQQMTDRMARVFWHGQDISSGRANKSNE